MALYNDKVMDHFMNPRNVGEIENPDGSGTYGSPVCGDMMMITIKVDNDVITDAKFKTFGCGSAIASSSMATEMIIGKTIDEALAITNKDIVDELGGLPAIKLHCSVLADHAISALSMIMHRRTVRLMQVLRALIRMQMMTMKKLSNNNLLFVE